MTAKSVLRFFIGYVIAAVLMGLLLPQAGIPRAQLLPPPMVYSYASGKANGVHMMWDCSGRSSRNGAYNRPISESPRISNGYYYIPLYRKLKGLN